MLLLLEKVILHKQLIMDQNKNPNMNETKHHLNLNQLLCVFSYFAVIWVVISNIKKNKNNMVPVFNFEEILWK